MERVATHPDAEMVVSAAVGVVGLPATYKAIEQGKHIALANKEVMVAAGEVVTAAVKRNGVALLPVDSEHNAIHQCLRAGEHREVKRLVLTASGGPFRKTPAAQFKKITPKQALAHPNWKMGQRITIDSATLMNKGFEVIEAKWLFGMDLDQIKVVIHPQSTIHSIVEFVDGSILAQLGPTDMRMPIQYALTYPERTVEWTCPRLVRAAPARFRRRPGEKVSLPAAGTGSAASGRSVALRIKRSRRNRGGCVPGKEIVVSRHCRSHRTRTGKDAAHIHARHRRCTGCRRRRSRLSRLEVRAERIKI